LWEYIASQSQSDQPLQLAGFDCQFTASASREFLADDIQQLAMKLGVESISVEEWGNFHDQLEKLAGGESAGGDRESFFKVLNEMSSALAGLSDETKLSRQESSFWKQQLISMSDHCRRELEGSESGMAGVQDRDAQMAKNLVWLANEQYPDRKIIVWAASFHIVRDPQGIRVPDRSVDYSNVKQMGQRVHEALGDDVFTVGFTTFGGKAGTWFRSSFGLSNAPDGTIESLASAASLENALIPLRAIEDPDGAWLNEMNYSRPLGYCWMEARWPKHFDAMIFNRTMQPSTSR
jgi:erythromycin esterase